MILARLWMLPLVCLGAASCSHDTAGSVKPPRLDTLLGGGLPVALGEPFSRVYDYRHLLDEDAVSSLPGESVREGDALYSYFPGGGLDFIAFYAFGRVGRVCVTFETADIVSDTAQAAAVAHRVMAGLGSGWQAIAAPSGVRRWRARGSLEVGYRFEAPATTCIDTEPTDA